MANSNNNERTVRDKFSDRMMEDSMPLIRKSYTVEFITPAFLGDADQKSAWRTPPFKALIREWWRIVAARNCEYDHESLRETEGRLFGHAWTWKSKAYGDIEKKGFGFLADLESILISLEEKQFLPAC